MALRHQANGFVNGNSAHVTKNLECDPAHPPSALPSESDPDGGPVGIATRKRLMEWWEREYCAGRMKLAVIGRGETKETFVFMCSVFLIMQNPSMNLHSW